MKNSKENLLLENLGKSLKKRRVELNKSQELLAQECDFDRTYISLIERGKRNPSYINLLKLCQGLQMNITIINKDDNDIR